MGTCYSTICRYVQILFEYFDSMQDIFIRAISSFRPFSCRCVWRISSGPGIPVYVCMHEYQSDVNYVRKDHKLLLKGFYSVLSALTWLISGSCKQEKLTKITR